MGNTFKDIIRQLESQRTAIDRALDALRAVDGSVGDEPARPAPVKSSRKAKKAATKSRLSPEARERIAAAQRKRWAVAKKAGKKALAAKAA